eukprot:4995543-Prymnesium_polylepis.2
MLLEEVAAALQAAAALLLPLHDAGGRAADCGALACMSARKARAPRRLRPLACARPSVGARGSGWGHPRSS